MSITNLEKPVELEEVKSTLREMQQVDEVSDDLKNELSPFLRKYLTELVAEEETSILLIDLCCQKKLDPNITNDQDMPLLHILANALVKFESSVKLELAFNSRYYHFKRFLCFSNVDRKMKYGVGTAYNIVRESSSIHSQSYLVNLLHPNKNLPKYHDSNSSSERMRGLCVYRLYDLAISAIRAEHETNAKIAMYDLFVGSLFNLEELQGTSIREKIFEWTGKLSRFKRILPKKSDNLKTSVELLLLCDNYGEACGFLKSTRGEQRANISILIRNYFTQREKDNEIFGNLQESAEFESEKQDILAEIEKILAEDQIAGVKVEDPGPDKNNEADAELVVPDVSNGEGIITQTSQTVPSEATDSGAQVDSSCRAVASSSAQADGSRTIAVSAMVQRGTAISAGGNNTVHEEITESRESIREGKREVDIGEKLIGVRPSKSQ